MHTKKSFIGSIIICLLMLMLIFMAPEILMICMIPIGVILSALMLLAVFAFVIAIPAIVEFIGIVIYMSFKGGEHE